MKTAALKASTIGLAALFLAACGAPGVEGAAPESGRVDDAAPPGAAEAQTVPAEAEAADAAISQIAGEWRCKAQDNIPIGVLTISPAGGYEFVVVKNSLWEPKPGDPGNGSGRIGVEGGAAKPLNGPLVDAYEIVDIGFVSDQRGTKTYFNNDYGTLLVCTPASRGG